MRGGKSVFVGCAIAFLISWTGASLLAQETGAAASAEFGANAASPATPEASAPPAPPTAYPELESQISRLKAENASLQTREGELSRQIKDQDAELSSLMIKLTTLVQGQKLLNPVRVVSPALANAMYIFGALSLLLLVLLWPSAARKALSLSYLSELPARKTDGGGVRPISNAARWFWALLAAILILLLMIPASAQDAPAPPAEPAPAAAAETPADAPSAEAPASETPEAPAGETPPAGAGDVATQQPAAPAVPTLKPEFDQALSYMDFTPLRRALYILENAKDGEAFNLALERELVEEMIKKADEKGRKSVVELPDGGGSPVEMRLTRDKLAYCLVLASLFELDGQDDKVKPLVEKGIAPLIADGNTLLANPSLTADQLEPIMLFAAACGLTDAVKVMAPKFMEKASKLSHVAAALESAHRVNLDEVYKATVSKLFEAEQNMAVIKAIVELTLSHGRKESAAIPLDKVFGQQSPSVDDGLLLLPLYAQVKDASQVEAALSGLAGKADFDGLLALADTASSLNLARQVQQCLEKAADNWGADYEKLFDKAQALNETRRVMEAAAGRLKRREAAGDQSLERGWPEGCGASIYEKEPVSLESYVAMSLYGFDPEHPQVQELLEKVVGNGLNKIIASYGVEPLLPINDLYALVHYYQATGNPGQESSQKMLAVQRRLRGLDTAAPMDDPLKLALQMEIDKLSERNGQLKDSVAAKERQTAELALDILDARGKWTVALAEVLAKAALLLIGLWIALVRATGAARLAHSFRFSHFFLTFAETIGFECCCTVVGLPAGIAVTLVSQDRLKHLRIAELPGPLTAPASPPPPIPVSTDAVPSPRVDAPQNPPDAGLSSADGDG